MTLKKIGIILFLIFSFLPIQKIFAQTTNTGFVPTNIWYSKDPFEEGDKIKIYTLIFNPDSKKLSGTVNFFDNTTLLGKKDFSISANATSAISINWTVTAGDHSIFGKIENAKFLLADGSYQSVSLTENQTEKSARTVAKKIVPDTTSTSQTNNSVSSLVSDVKNIIADKTPDFISEPIGNTTNAIEGLRNDMSVVSDNKKSETQKEIQALDSTKTTKDPKTAPSSLLKPFKYVELFFLTISSFILGNRYIFYSILIILIFFILRFIWNKIF